MPALVIDLGGTHLRCGVAAGRGLDHVTSQRIETFLDQLSTQEVTARVVARVEAYLAELPLADVGPIVMAFPGPIANGRRVVSAPTLYGPDAGALPDIAGVLEQNTGLDVHMLNDVSAAAWALSRRSNVNRFLVVTVSSGIGSKLFDRGNHLGVLDDPVFSGEIGHYVVDRSADAPRCDCGGLGHLGGIASGRGVERLARRIRCDNALTNERDIVPAFRRGERWAMDILTSATQPLATTLLAVTMCVGLDKVFIIGGFAQNIGQPYGALLNRLLVEGSRYSVLEGHLGDLVEVLGPDEQLCLSGAAFYASARGFAA